ncbi:hypothetical protein BDR26DRAFT_1011208 [Obelidium mucronatum]|nr:hypothetical protein BDR26DRAFT_1011208 [Obelidium mucronatum]
MLSPTLSTQAASFDFGVNMVQSPLEALCPVRGVVTSPSRSDEFKPTSTAEPVRIETYFGFVEKTVDAYFLVEACVSGTLPCVREPIRQPMLPVRSGSVIVFELTDNDKKMKWNDGKQWSIATKEGSFVYTREVEPTNSKVHARATQREKSNLFVSCKVRPDTKLIPNGLVRRCISMNGSDGKRYRVLSYFYPCHVQQFYVSAGKTRWGRGPLQTPSEQPKFERFIKQWIAFNFAKKQKQKMEDELSPLPPSIIPLDMRAPQQGVPVDDWDRLEQLQKTQPQEQECIKTVGTVEAGPLTPSVSPAHQKQTESSSRKRTYSVMNGAVDGIPTPIQSLDAVDSLLLLAQQSN